ncbi:MAG: hypothetical protein R3B97_09350 [Dehalococcoidia bacterium]
MRHEAARELLPLHAIGVVTSTDAADVARHIATCRQCAQESEIYAFAAAALDAAAGADPAVMHSADPLPPMTDAAMDRIAAEVFEQLGGYAPEWPGPASSLAPAPDGGSTMWGLTAEDDHAAGDLIRGIANQDELSLQGAAGFADSMTLRDIDGNRPPELQELSGQSRGARGWVGPGDASIIGMADEEWPQGGGSLPPPGTAGGERWPDRAVGADEPGAGAPAEWESGEDDTVADDWAGLATGAVPPASDLLDEATSLRTVISRLKANSSSAEPRAVDLGVDTPPAAEDASLSGSTAELPAVEAASPDLPAAALTPPTRPVGEGRRGLGGLFRRTREREPVEGAWDDLFYEGSTPAAVDSAPHAGSSAPMLPGNRSEARDDLPQPAEGSRPPLPPEWLARTGGAFPAESTSDESEDPGDSWTELALAAEGRDKASTPDPILDAPLVLEDFDEGLALPATELSATEDVTAPPEPSAWTPAESGDEGTEMEADDWADLLSGETGEITAATPADAPRTIKEAIPVSTENVEVLDGVVESAMSEGPVEVVSKRPGLIEDGDPDVDIGAGQVDLSSGVAEDVEEREFEHRPANVGSVQPATAERFDAIDDADEDRPADGPVAGVSGRPILVEDAEDDADFEDSWADLFGSVAEDVDELEPESPSTATLEADLQPVPTTPAIVDVVAEAIPSEIPAGVVSGSLAPAESAEDHADVEDDWGERLSGAAEDVDELDGEGPPAAMEPVLPPTTESLEGVWLGSEVMRADVPAEVAADSLALVEGGDEDETFEDDWAELLAGAAEDVDELEPVDVLPATTETLPPTVPEDLHVVDVTADILAVESSAEVAAESPALVEGGDEDETFEDGWAELLSGAAEDVDELEAVDLPLEPAEADPVAAVAEDGTESPLLTAIEEDDFADNWAGLALAEEEEERAADEAFAMAALEDEPDSIVRENGGGPLLEASALAGDGPAPKKPRRRFGLLRRRRAGSEESSTGTPVDVPWEEQETEDGTLHTPGGVEEATTEASAAALPETVGDDRELMGGSSAESPVQSEVLQDAGGPGERFPEVPPVVEPAAAEASFVPADAEVPSQPGLFPLEGLESTGEEALLAATAGETAKDDVEPVAEFQPGTDAVAAETALPGDDEVVPREVRSGRFGWLRRAIPGGEDLEDDWATVAASAPATSDETGPDAAEVVLAATGATELPAAVTPETDSGVDIDEELPAAEETDAEIADVTIMDAQDAGPAEAAETSATMPASSVVTDPGEPYAVKELAVEPVETGPQGGEPDEIAATAMFRAAASAEDEETLDEEEVATGGLDDLFAADGDDSDLSDVGTQRSRRRFGWFRGRRGGGAAEPDQDEWATIAAAQPPAEGEPFERDSAAVVQPDYTFVEKASEEPALLAAAEPVQEDADVVMVDLESSQESTAELDGGEPVDGEEPAAAFAAELEDEVAAPDMDGSEEEPEGESEPGLPRPASGPPSRHRLREMMRRRRIARHKGDDGDPHDAEVPEEEPPDAPEAQPELEPEPTYLAEELEELAPADEEAGRSRRRRGPGAGRRHRPGERQPTGTQRGALRRALGRDRANEGEEDEEAAVSPWAEVLRSPERPPSAPLAGAFATPYIPGPVDWGLERYDDDEPDEDEDGLNAASSSWRFWTVLFAISTVVLFGLLIGGIVLLVNLRQESLQLEVAKDAAAVPITFTSSTDPDVYSGEGYLERERGQALLTLKGITAAEKGQQYVIWADNGTGTVTPVAWTTGRSSSSTQYIPLNRVPRDVQRLYITLETFSGKPEAPPLGDILLEAPTP